MADPASFWTGAAGIDMLDMLDALDSLLVEYSTKFYRVLDKSVDESHRVANATLPDSPTSKRRPMGRSAWLTTKRKHHLARVTAWDARRDIEGATTRVIDPRTEQVTAVYLTGGLQPRGAR